MAGLKLLLFNVGYVIIFIGCQTEPLVLENYQIMDKTFLQDKIGSDRSFDIATWNIEHFPKDRVYTLPLLTRIINKIDLDLIAVQEIDDSVSFLNLLDSLNGYNGFVSTLPVYGQRTGLIYKSKFISISNPDLLFADDEWLFPRPPLITYVTIKDDNRAVFDFILIILHLKAFSDSESESRRRMACQKLKNYIDKYLLTAAEKDILIVGDFNDELNDPPQNNIFTIFLNDSTTYKFLTHPLTNEATYIGNKQSSIDHILMTVDGQTEYDGGQVQVLKIDNEISNYLNHISDHRPVLAQFFVF